ncbi:hypothetical protein STCU_05086 [Strigomonas culicis]|uniref:Uncharacterized protein n=1 Tax=Strigomonas culicis TaxID=28005 RepID=S9UIC7_9TRYP|nr:hypothetical protein STCU_05086 [Strigomonas culicis]|eukprot:EPY28494.1 hypothetical protein STCU_05086 [Strigomonas culicis]
MHFYMWLPVELEPEYREGFVCDACSREFLEGPFYHAEETGVDYCSECGSKSGFSVFLGTVASIIFLKDDTVLKDNDTNAVVAFAYKTNRATTYFFFTNGSSAQVVRRGKKEIKVLLFASNTQQIQVISQIEEKFPWMRTFEEHIEREIRLHDVPPLLPNEENRIFLNDYEITKEQITLSFNNGFRQVLDYKEGIEILFRQQHVVSLFKDGELCFDKKLFQHNVAEEE